MTDLAFTSMVDLARLVRTKAASPVEIVRAHLDRIARHDSALASYITVMADAARAAATAAESAVVTGAPLGPLHGVPLGLKDLYCTRGVRTTAGSKILGDFVPAEDATVVSRLVG